MTSEFNFFQLHNGVDGGAVGGVTQQGRPFDKKMSNFGDLASTPVNVFKGKDELTNITPDNMDVVADKNPLVWDSTVKRTKDDKFVVMMLGSIAPHTADVNSRNEASADKAYYMPVEGWRSFGGKDDMARDYQGGRLKG